MICTSVIEQHHPLQHFAPQPPCSPGPPVRPRGTLSFQLPPITAHLSESSAFPQRPGGAWCPRSAAHDRGIHHGAEQQLRPGEEARVGPLREYLDQAGATRPEPGVCRWRSRRRRGLREWWTPRPRLHMCVITFVCSNVSVQQYSMCRGGNRSPPPVLSAAGRLSFHGLIAPCPLTSFLFNSPEGQGQ